ncbi:MAG: SRPBCC domain-containing protein [Deltaproteobacteria bacterium]|nr:SRPBCC domain-containing protein [Deltaproteobacteria bacterium]
MAAGSSAVIEPAAYTLMIERIFDAPRELVFQAWIDPAHLVHWLGPQGFTGTMIKMDVRPGGAYRFHLRSAEGIEYWMQGIYQEVVAPERFVRTCVWADVDGNPTTPESLMTVIFEEHEGKTKLKFQQAFESAAACDAHRGGTESALDRLVEYLAAVA